MWQNPAYQDSLQLGAIWLDAYNHPPATTLHFYPAPYAGAFFEPEDAFYRLGVVMLLGGDHNGLDAALGTLWASWQPLVQSVAGYTTPFVLYEELGIPRSDYWH